MNPLVHSKISVNRCGGRVEDYYKIHQLIDCTKEVCSDNRHRIFHTHWGIYRVIIPLIGNTVTTSDNKVVSVKDICEKDHILPDYRNRFIPTLADFVDAINEDRIVDWRDKITAIHDRYKGIREMEELLLSPLMLTGRMKSLLLTHNSWFINEIARKLYGFNVHLIDYEISAHEVFNAMAMKLWMDNGADYPMSSGQINKVKPLYE